MSAPSAAARQVARAAAQWLALLESGAASEAEHAQLQRWRESHVTHEQAWQKAQGLRQRFAQLPPELALASLDRPALGRRTLLKQALGVAVLVPSAWLLSRQLPFDTWRADLHTATGERQQRRLASGALLQLNTASAVDLAADGRGVTLVAGEMALQVTAGNPATVHSEYGQLTLAPGDVCLRLEPGACRVSVRGGEVRVQPVRGQALLLRAGQQVRLAATGAGVVEPFDAALPGWREGVLSAQEQPLGDFLRELARYRPGVLRWAPELESLRVSGSFQLADTDRILALLAASLPLEVQGRTRYWVSLVPRKKIG